MQFTKGETKGWVAQVDTERRRLLVGATVLKSSPPGSQINKKADSETSNHRPIEVVLEQRVFRL